MFARIIFFGITVLLPLRAVAQPVAPLQQNPIDRLAPVQVPQVAPSLEAPPVVPQTGPGTSRRVRIAEVAVAGATALKPAAFEAALAPLRGTEVALGQIEDARIAVLNAYRRAGYPFAAIDAGLTPRPDGAEDLSFQVTEGFIAEVRLEGDEANIGPAGAQVLRFLQPLTAMRPIGSDALERALLLASDIPGLTVRGVVRPLKGEPGALQLVAQVSRKAFSGYANVDNRGSKFSGPWQGLLALSANSFTSIGERTELAFFGAQGGTQYFVQGTSEGYIGGSGLKFRVWAGAGWARPGSTLAAIGYQGETQVYGGSLSFPLLRRRPISLFAVAQLDAFDSTVNTNSGGGSTQASRDSVRVLRGGMDLQALDDVLPWVPSGTTVANFRLHHGLSGLGASANDDPQSARAGSRFNFAKGTFDVQRIQPLFAPFRDWMLGVQGIVAGQLSNDILPQVEKFYLGGARLNRGFYAGQITGDNAITYSAELQLSTGFDLPFQLPRGISNHYETVFYGFHDWGRTWENVKTDPNRKLTSSGLGVRVDFSQTVSFDIEGVHRATRRPDGANADPLHSNGIYFRTLVRF